MHVLYTHLNWFKENGFCVFISHIKLHALVYGGKARLDVLVSLWHYIMQFFRCCKWLLSQSDTFDSLLLLQVYDYLSLKYINHISKVQEFKNLSIFASKTLQTSIQGNSDTQENMCSEAHFHWCSCVFLILNSYTCTYLLKSLNFGVGGLILNLFSRKCSTKLTH